MDKKDKKERKSKCETPCREAFEPLHITVKTKTTLVLLLSSPEDNVVGIACEAIYGFAEKDDMKVYLMKLGVLEPLSQLISHSNELVRRNAFMVLSRMVTDSTVVKALQKMAVVPPIIKLLDDAVIKEYGTLCLSFLSVDPTFKVQIVENKGLPPLIKLLSSSEPDVQKNSLETIYNLVQNSQFWSAVRELGGVSLLLELLNSQYVVIQQLAVKTLKKVTTDKDSHGVLRKEQGPEKLVEVLKNETLQDLHVDALQIIANCISDSDIFQLVQNAGGLPLLMTLVLPPKLPDAESGPVKCMSHEIQSTAVECVSRAAQIPESHKVLHELKAEEILLDLLTVGNDGLKILACQAVAAMSSFLTSKEHFRELGLLPVLIRFLSSHNLALRGEAVQALANLTSGNKLNTVAIYEARGLRRLIRRLGDTCPRTVANAAAILCRIAGQEAIRCDVLSHGAMPALVKPLKSTDAQVLINATLCICELAFSAEARAQLWKANGLEPLVILLRSSHMEVLRCTCMAISVCAKDEPMAVEMCKFGALGMLQEINQSENSKSKFGEFALNSLIQSSLSLKFGLTDCLASTDVITDGFYDAGKSGFSQKVLTLEELSMEPVNQSLPIIAVNASTKNSEDGAQPKNEVQFESPHGKMINDVGLQLLVKEVKESILLLNDEVAQYAALAWRVSDAMGGAIEKEDMHGFGWLLDISLLKFQLQCNVVPIGMIRKGFYCHRALLFKYLADCIGLKCTLVRGHNNRAWNEIVLYKEDPSSDEYSIQPCCYIVDLMHEPGNLIRSNTSAAIRYNSI
ncbi:armadillo repeat-containing protein 3-like [Nerophis ophidion]|uniref:armadillo repeat-containing protein 3-like n=1 Tax=Nerophis ophidion TaxID=159077 RepID=UPI002AE0396D|nr:armadillo repeat-containing protein 3-like [Nerophis ophidion]